MTILRLIHRPSAHSVAPFAVIFEIEGETPIRWRAFGNTTACRRFAKGVAARPAGPSTDLSSMTDLSRGATIIDELPDA